MGLVALGAPPFSSTCTDGAFTWLTRPAASTVLFVVYAGSGEPPAT